MTQVGVVSTPRRSRNPQGEGGRLREELIQAADRLLAQAGSDEELSLRAVAREAGVAAPSVYLHFGSKAELIHTVMLAHFAELRRMIEEAIDQEAAPGDRLRAGCLAYCRFAAERPGAYRVLFGKAFFDLAFEPGLGMDTFAVLVDAIAACIAAGAAPAGDPFRLATNVWTTLHGIVTLRRSVPTFPWPPLDEQVEDLLVGLVGIARREPDEPRATMSERSTTDDR